MKPGNASRRAARQGLHDPQEAGGAAQRQQCGQRQGRVSSAHKALTASSKGLRLGRRGGQHGRRDSIRESQAA
ncbi:hypothetical protein BUE93_07845 [Chromobacterium amazonense]|uniref:Uncharacterized protein n=1 Tax=Chromobacterium amazonense TaxID=1382803 RepID=A0A2S9X5W5_9NEIS|nr:hypothetical protein BUE93_07845 [Chromobacterium amazonense]